MKQNSFEKGSVGKLSQYWVIAQFAPVSHQRSPETFIFIVTLTCLRSLQSSIFSTRLQITSPARFKLSTVQRKQNLQ